MKIKRSRRQDILCLLVRVGVLFMMIIAFNALFSISRISNDDLAPNYKDGDLVICFRFNNEKVLLFRVRGFDD